MFSLTLCVIASLSVATTLRVIVAVLRGQEPEWGDGYGLVFLYKIHWLETDQADIIVLANID